MATLQTLLPPAAGFASDKVASFVAGLDDQTRRLLEALEDIGVDELAWQPAPGINTIGMLLAHIAIAEVHLTDVGLARLPDSRILEVLGIPVDDDGMPLPEDGLPPAALAGKDLAFFRGVLDKARQHLRQVAAPLTDQDLAQQVTRVRPDGTTRIFDVRWIVYHLLEHEAGHHAQILLLRHLHRSMARAKVG